MNQKKTFELFVCYLCKSASKFNTSWADATLFFSRAALAKFSVIQPSRCQRGCALPAKMWLRNCCTFHYRFNPSPRLRRQGFTGTPLQNHRQRHVCTLWISGTCCKHYSLWHPAQTKSSHLPIIRCWAHPGHKDVGRACLAREKVVTSEKTPEEIVTITDTQTGQHGRMKQNVLRHSLPVILTKWGIKKVSAQLISIC